jgi:hypothetical protein
MRNLKDSIEWIGYTVNELNNLNNVISGIGYNSPIMFIDIAKGGGKKVLRVWLIGKIN